jgi:hypothetical protein
LIPFQSAWQTIKRIEGWLTEIEAARLYQCACSLKEGSRILEIGSYKGRSAVLFALSGHSVTCVDPYRGEPKFIEAHTSFLMNTVKYKNIRLYACLFERFESAQNYDLIYIDASHGYPHPKNDFLRAKTMENQDATFLFHDYNKDGVRKSIDELILEGLMIQVGELSGSVFEGRAK